MRRHLRQVVAHQGRIGGELGHCGAVVEVGRRTPRQPAPSLYSASVWMPAILRAPQVLALLGDGGPDGRQRHVRHRVLDAIIEPGRPPGQVAGRLDADAGFPADETLRTELIVGEGQHGADAELPVELVERRRAEAPAEVAPDAEPAGEVVAAPRRAGCDRVVASPAATARCWPSARRSARSFSRLWPS